MRFVLAALTVGTAALGYHYLHQPALPAAEHVAADRGLFDWESAGNTLDAVSADRSALSEPPLIVRDTIESTRGEINSVLDEFVRENVPAAAPSADIVTQPAFEAASVEAASPVRHEVVVEEDDELIPFASSDAPPMAVADESDAPADASQVVNRSTPEPAAITSAQPTNSPTADPASANPHPATSAPAASAPAAASAITAASNAPVSPTSAPALTPTTVAEATPAAAAPSATATGTALAAAGATAATTAAVAAPQPTQSKSPSPTTASPAALTGTPAAPVAQSTAAVQKEVSGNTSVASRPKTELLPGGKAGAPQVEFDRDWKVIGKSTRGLDLHARGYGRQGFRTLVIAGLDGQDVLATRWADELAAALTTQADLLQSSEIVIIRAGNPDGLVKRSAANSRGVLINRNFPSRRYQFLTDRSAGPGPASEAETHAILETLYSFRPRRVIHLTSASGKSSVLSNRAARELAMALENQFSLDRRLIDPEQLPGSLEDFADGTLDASMITLKLSSDGGWRESWPKHQPVVLAALRGAVPLETVSKNDGEVGARIPTAEPARKRRMGYEELPKPPQ